MADMSRSQAKTAQKAWARNVYQELGSRALVSFKLPSIVPLSRDAPTLFPASCCWRSFHILSKYSPSVSNFMPFVVEVFVSTGARYFLVVVEECRDVLELH